jgi:benzoate/toluate 1,2-dioxygenase reductase subunit
VEHILSVLTGSSILAAGLDAGLPLLHQCRSGTCSSCLATLTEGEAGTLHGSNSSLFASEMAAGKRLLCVSQARSDCRFTLDYDSNGGQQVSEAQTFVNSVERVAADVMRLELELAEGSWIDFRPGQFIQLKVPGTDQTRSYSIASTPAQLPKIELLVRLLPDGVMSEWLRNRAAPDAVVEIAGPHGAFFLREGAKSPHIMIAGGTGLAPMMAMIDQIRARPGRKPPILLSFGCTSDEGLFQVNDVVFAGEATTPCAAVLEAAADSDDADAHVLLVSGLQVGAAGSKQAADPAAELAAQLLVDFVAGRLGGPADVARASRIARAPSWLC